MSTVCIKFQNPTSIQNKVDYDVNIVYAGQGVVLEDIAVGDE